jgi:tRNA threonylcarbamoyl adenosine modification protein YeaZ
MDKKITLAIETTIGGGSLALFRGDAAIASMTGSAHPSRAEDLLDNISKMFSDNKIQKKDLDMLAVSLGPGSYTGARIGMATAQGIKNGLNIKYCGATILEALASAISFDGKVLAAVTSGKNEICFQEFEKKGNEQMELSKPQLSSIEEFLNILERKKEENGFRAIFENNLFMTMQEHFTKSSDFYVRASENLSVYIGQYCINRYASDYASDNPKPLYLHSLK